jgi:hypothetical protein
MISSSIVAIALLDLTARADLLDRQVLPPGLKTVSLSE